MKGLNLSKFRKMAEDSESATMVHEDGHQIRLAKASLPALQRKQLEKLPLHLADGTDDVEPEEDKSDDFTQGIDYGQNSTPNVPDETGVPYSVANALPLPTSPNIDLDVESPLDKTATMADKQLSAPNPDAPITASPAQDLSKQGSMPDLPLPAAKQESTDLTPQPQKLGMTPEGTIAAGQAGIKGQETIDAANSAQNVQLQQKYLADSQALEASRQQHFAEFSQHQQQVMDDIKNNHINPQAYVQNMSTEKKVGTAIGLFLGSLGSAYTHSPNAALDYLNKQIDRDIESQKATQGDRKTLLQANQELYHDQVLGENATRVNLNDILAHKIQLQAAQMGTQQAHVNANLATYKLGEENKDLMLQNANRAVLLKAKQDPNVDPAQLVRFTNAPQPDQAKIYDEIKVAQNINEIRKPSIDAFWKAAQDVRPLTGGAHTSMTAFIPGMESAGQKAFSGLANTTVKEIEGTARKAAMDSISHNFRPSFGDSDATIQGKFDGWQQYLNAQAAAPVAKGYGLDLSQYKTTNHNVLAAPPPPNVQNAVQIFMQQNPTVKDPSVALQILKQHGKL